MTFLCGCTGNVWVTWHREYSSSFHCDNTIQSKNKICGGVGEPRPKGAEKSTQQAAGCVFLLLCDEVNTWSIPWRVTEQGIPKLSRQRGCLSVCLFVYWFLRERMLTCLDKSWINKNNITWHMQGGNTKYSLFALGIYDRSVKTAGCYLIKCPQLLDPTTRVCASRHPGISGVFLWYPPSAWAAM